MDNRRSIALSYITITEQKLMMEKELIFIKVLEGSVIIRKNHELQCLNKNDIVCINPGNYFVLTPESNHNLVTMMKLDSKMCKVYEKGVGPRYYMMNSAKFEKLYPELYMTARHILESITRYEVFENKRELHKHLKELFFLLINHFNFITCGISHEEFSKKMQMRYIYIYKNYFKLSNHDTLRVISDDLNLNYDHLRKDISRRFGSTYHQMKDVIRVNKAVKLLFESELSITEISTKVGFSDHKYMVDRFKKRFDMTPSDLRKINNVSTSSYMKYMKYI